MWSHNLLFWHGFNNLFQSIYKLYTQSFLVYAANILVESPSYVRHGLIKARVEKSHHVTWLATFSALNSHIFTPREEIKTRQEVELIRRTNLSSLCETSNAYYFLNIQVRFYSPYIIHDQFNNLLCCSVHVIYGFNAKMIGKVTQIAFNMFQEHTECHFLYPSLFKNCCVRRRRTLTIRVPYMY